MDIFTFAYLQKAKAFDVLAWQRAKQKDKHNHSARVLKLGRPDERSLQVSHEAIRKSAFIKIFDALRNEQHNLLRTKRRY